MSAPFWNDRYSTNGLVYGSAPNEFLVEAARLFPKQGKAIDLGAGEGRNAIYLASLGLDVLAVDQSEVGLRKAERLAGERGLRVATRAVDLRDFDVEPGSLDVVSSIFVHLPRELRETVHRRVVGWLRSGGVFVLESYAPEQLHRDTGGPKDPDMLPPVETLEKELTGLALVHRASVVRTVIEGDFHSGESAVVQIIGRKP